MEHPIETNEKIRKNAISAYLMLFVSGFFLSNTHNPLLANDFVKAHTKTAFLLHVSFLAVVLIFLWFGLGDAIVILGFGVNSIIASTLLLMIFAILLYGIHKAHKGEYFTIMEVVHITKTEKIVDINNDHTLDEKDKLAIILSYVPFLGYIVYGMHSENSTLQNITKINVLANLIIGIIFVSGYYNLALLLMLFYIIFVVFSSIILVGKNEILSLNLQMIPSVRDIEYYIKTLLYYIHGFFGKKFKTLKETLDFELQKEKALLEQKTAYIQSAPTYRLPLLTPYIPLINLIHIFYNQNKFYYHITNGVSITLLLVLSWLLLGFDNLVQGLLLFPFFFGVAFLKHDLTYSLPIIGYIGRGFLGTFDFFGNMIFKAKKLSKKKEEITLKPEEKK